MQTLKQYKNSDKSKTIHSLNANKDTEHHASSFNISNYLKINNITSNNENRLNNKQINSYR